MPNQQSKSLRDLLLLHQLLFIALILIAVLSGGYGIHIWDKASKESARINGLVQEIYQVRGDLYRQMKELFDGFLLKDKDALNEYNAYTQTIIKEFANLKTIAQGQQEQQAISEIEQHYKIFVNEAPSLFYRYQAKPDSHTQKSLYQDIETGIFSQYELVSKQAEQLLKIKQEELKAQLEQARLSSILVLSIPVLLALVLLFLSRVFLKQSIVKPIHAITNATQAISAGNLDYKVPETGALELATLSKQINQMAGDLSKSRDALVRSEKQAALGLLVPMLAHNIRNPLASIRATAQVTNDPSLDADTRESMQGIIQTVDRLERWTSVLLAYLNPIKPQLSQVSLNAIVQAVEHLLAEKLKEKNITFTQAINLMSANITTDEHLLEQMLYNLILNAIEASPKNSTIYFNAAIINQQLEISIVDQGIGMPFKPDPHAISPGPTTKRFGTGLGIPFAFKVCEVLNGKIDFSNNSSKNGTVINISLPQAIDFNATL